MWEIDKENPRSTPSLKKFLEYDKHFNPTVIDEFIQSYRDTISFAKLGIGDRVVTGDGVDDEQFENGIKKEIPPAIPRTDSVEKFKKKEVEPAMNTGELQIAIAGKTVPIPFPMSEDDFDLFIGTLQLWKKKLVRKLSPIPPAVSLPADAVWKNNDTDKPVKIVAIMGERDGVLFYQSEDGTGIPASQLKF